MAEIILTDSDGQTDGQTDGHDELNIRIFSVFQVKSLTVAK